MPIGHRKQGFTGRMRLATNRLPLSATLVKLVCLLAPVILGACANPQATVPKLTPIPTLIPATMIPSRLGPTATPALVIESFPAGIPLAASGQILYAQYCSECHGADGSGQVPDARNFGDFDYMRGETPLDFYLAITEGVPSIEEVEYEMPAFGDSLSTDERWDLVYYIWRFATSDERLSVGREIFSTFCEECHGADGRSQVLDAADLSDQRFISHQSPSTLYLSVTRGRGSMPAFQARLSQDERWMVIEYLRSFSYDPQLIEEVSVTGEETATQDEEEQSVCDPSYLTQNNPFAWGDPQAIAVGEPIYERECTDCHGEDGTGAIPQVPDYTNPAVRGALMENPGEQLCRVAEGINRMPAFKSTLTQTEMWQVLTYIASLGG